MKDNMKFKLKPDYFTDRLPLVIYRRDNTIYFQLQHEVVGFGGYRDSIFCEYDKISTYDISKIGLKAINLLNRFHEISDFTPSEIEEMLQENSNNSFPFKNAKFDYEIIKAWNIDGSNCDMCNIKYFISDDKYIFNIWWHKKSSKYPVSCDSPLGESGILTFDTPLEFTDYSDPKALGKMIIEALDRSRKISDKVAGNPYPEKAIELLSGKQLIVSAPRDKHFADEEDNGVCEIYQGYGYYPREDSEESSAEFYLGIAAELDCDMSEENILKAWENQHGKAEFFEVKSVEHGIFKLRAEMRNKSVHRISYLLQIDESELLDCTMELHMPNKRKKLDEKLVGLFEEFAVRCRFK